METNNGQYPAQEQRLRLERDLDSPDIERRLEALGELKAMLDGGMVAGQPSGRDVNNHIHTTYSFSPYSPAKAVWLAKLAGLATAGIMDHDSVAGTREFCLAGKIVGLPTTIGLECRASFADTALAGRRLNNPDQASLAYVALHGIPHNRIDALDAYFRPIRAARDRRNRLMTDRLDRLMQPAGITLDYDRDVLPLSRFAEGGETTERHLLFAAAIKLLSRFGPGPALSRFLAADLGITPDAKASLLLTEQTNPYRAYDLLNVLKRDLVERFYLDAAGECPPIGNIVRLAEENGVILAYAYLGDVTDSVTGDKRSQNFEDGYLDELFVVLRETGFRAVTYMPSRNSQSQLLRLRGLCDQYGFFQISGEDINQPRQPFVCLAMQDPLFANLYDSAWALIGHERLATDDLADGLFSARSLRRWPDLAGRTARFAQVGRDIFGC